jgi:hypothetical protein
MDDEMSQKRPSTPKPIPRHYTQFVLPVTIDGNAGRIEDMAEDDDVWDVIRDEAYPISIFIHFVREDNKKVEMVNADAANALTLLIEWDKVEGVRLLREAVEDGKTIQQFAIPFHSFSTRTTMEMLTTMLPANSTCTIEMTSAEEATVTFATEEVPEKAVQSDSAL